jgi:hypothetical protein
MKRCLSRQRVMDILATADSLTHPHGGQNMATKDKNTSGKLVGRVGA